MNELSLNNEATQVASINPLDNSLMSKENFNHWFSVADKLSKSSMVPKNYIGKAMDVFIAMEMGFQLGLPLLQSLQDIAVINGRPCLWGDGMLAVCQNHGDFEWIKEEALHDAKGAISGYCCTLKRKNNEEHSVVFTLDDAKKASLIGKPGPWSQYPSRMLQLRARAFALRDKFADALRGMKSAEEVGDYIDVKDYTITEMPKTQASSRLDMLLKNKNKTDKESEHDNEGFIENNARSKTEKDSQKTAQYNSGKSVDEAGEQATDTDDCTSEDEQCTHEQVVEIENLMHEKDFPLERLRGALNHYQVPIVKDLSASQARHFIAILNKEEAAV